MNGEISRNGTPISGQSKSDAMYSMLQGCHNPKSCHWPFYSGNEPTTFKVRSSSLQGFNAELFNQNGQSLGSITLPPSRVRCTNEGLMVWLHHGMAQDGAGAWTIGYERLMLVLTTLPNGQLLAKRTQKRFDVFWFGLPLVSEEGFWFVFDPVR